MTVDIGHVYFKQSEDFVFVRFYATKVQSYDGFIKASLLESSLPTLR